MTTISDCGMQACLLYGLLEAIEHLRDEPELGDAHAALTRIATDMALDLRNSLDALEAKMGRVEP